MGVTKSAVAQLRSTGQRRVLAATADSVTALYEDCWWRTPPSPSTTRSERYAERRQWVPPWRWDGFDIDDPEAKPPPDKTILDEIAIREAIAGRPVPLTRAERRFLEQLLEEQGQPAAAIAQLAGCHPRTIQRHRCADRSAA